VSTTVSLIRCGSYNREELGEALEAALAPFEGSRAFVQRGQQVVLKPNLLAPSTADEVVTTHPEFVGAVAVKVREAGGEPVVADSPAFGTVEQVAERNGLRKVCEELDLPLRRLRRSSLQSVETARGTRHYRVSREVLDADVVINLPKLKAHRQLGLSGAIKNLYGCLPGKRKIVGHFRGGPVDLNFARMIVEHYRAVSPALSLVDGIVAMEGKGPRRGPPRRLGWVLAGTDAVAVDAVLCDLLHAPTSHRLLLEAACELGVGETDIASIRLHGASADEVRVPDFEWPPLIGTQFGVPRVLKSWLRNLWITRMGLARAKSGA